MGFEVRLESKLSTQCEKEEDLRAYGVRVGWSVSSSSLLLGEFQARRFVRFAFSKRDLSEVFSLLHRLLVCFCVPVAFQVKTNSPLLMIVLVKKSQVGRRRSLGKCFHGATSSAVIL